MESLEPRRHLTATLLGSTYLGGNGDDVFRDGVVAPDGSVYLAGASVSSDLSLPAGGYDRTPNGNGDGLVVRLAGDLSAWLAGTLLGGGGWDKNTYGIDLDASGNVWVAGETRSPDYPVTATATQKTYGGGLGDGFLAKLNGGLSSLLYSTFLGGSGDDPVRGGLDVDASGRVTIAGWTESRDFSTTAGAYQRTHAGGTYDGYVARYAADGSRQWSTLLGGSYGTNWDDTEVVVGVKVAPDGGVYFVGTTTAGDFPQAGTGVYDRTHSGNGNADGFVGKLSSDGSRLEWLSFVGGVSGDFVSHQMAVDNQGRLVLVGATTGGGYPTTAGAYQRTSRGGTDVFVSVFNPDGSMAWSTLLGGSGDESSFGAHVDQAGNVYVAGWSNSGDFPVSGDAFQKVKSSGDDAYLARLSADGSTLSYASFLGGAGTDYARFVFGDGRGNVYVTGETSSGNFPTTAGALDRSSGGGFDAFVARFFFDDATGGGQQPAPELTVRRGTTTTITDGQASAVSFGSVQQGSTDVDVTFTVRNDGDATLSLGNVVLSNNSSFGIVTQPASSVGPGASTSFVLRMSTATAGSKTADVSFTSNDADESPFNFSVAGTVTTPTPPAEIAVERGQQDVPDGSATPISFGTVQVGATTPELTFTVRNSGGEPLSLGQVVLANNIGFAVVQQPAATVAPGASTTFVLRMLTTAVGNAEADVSFTNNDSDENPFNFAVAGTVTSLPREVEVRRSGTDITDGATTPVSFGSVVAGSAAPELTFTIHNTGGQDLTVGALELLNAVGFEIVRQPAANVAPGGSTDFVVRMLTAAPGDASGTVSFTNDDADENPFTFAIAGTVTAMLLPPEIRVTQVGSQIADGAATPVPFGEAGTGSSPIELTFTVHNDGEEPLTLGELTLLNNDGFEIAQQPAGTVAPGGTTTFVLRMLTAAAGDKLAAVALATNDADENPFDFSVAGTVTPRPSLAVTGSSGSDTVYVKRSGDEVQVWVNADHATAPPTHSAVIADLTSFTIVTGDGDDRVTLDFSGGDPLPAAGLSVGGDAGADRLTVVGGQGDESITYNGAALTLGTASVSVADLEILNVAASGGADALTFTGNAVVELVGAQSLAALTLSGSARVTMSGAVGTGALIINEQAVLDIGDGELILRTTPETKEAMLASVAAAIRSARDATPRWSGPGITSSAAMADSLVGVGTYVGQPDADSILVKRGYNGDANADGKVNADDYFRIDSGFLDPPAKPMYTEGDFNYDGKINADDYFLIDSAFLGQAQPALASSPVSSSTAGISSMIEQRDAKRSRSRARARESVFNDATRVARSRRG